jgi:DNA repair ATPase RecN
MKMKFLIQKSLPSPVKFVWKTLVVFILSALLFFPTPVLALDYSGTVQSYVSNAKVELDSVLTVIKKLQNLSYANGKTALAEIDTRLQKIQTDARKNATDFEKLGDEGQKESNQLLDTINNLYTRQQFLEKELQTNQEKLERYIALEQAVRGISALLNGGVQIATPFDNIIKSYEESNRLAISKLQSLKDSRAKLEIDNQNLSQAIVLADKISKLSTNLKNRVNDAKQKTSNIKAYAEELESFSDQDILSEISELDQFIADLTNNLPLGSVTVHTTPIFINERVCYRMPANC